MVIDTFHAMALFSRFYADPSNVEGFSEPICSLTTIGKYFSSLINL